MNRKEFLLASGSLIPMSFLGTSKADAAEAKKAAVSYMDSPAYQEHANALRFRADKKFKIVQFTDIHWVPGNPHSQVSFERMNEVLDAEKPDLVVYSGDIVTGRPAAEGYKSVLELVTSRGIPFAVTFGNHDDEQDLTRREIYDLIKDEPGNLTGTVEGLTGVTNYVLPIKSSDGKKDAFILYIFDSLTYSPDKAVEGYDWIKHDQIEWYRDCSAKLTAANGGKPYPALSFFHIPLPEYNQAAADEDSLLIGIRKEEACAPRVNSGLFTAMLEAKDVMGVFVGHDHVNDYVARWKGIALGYGRFTGSKTTYWDVPWGNGARVFELTEGERSFKSWIRLAKGRVIAEFQYPDDFKNADD